MLTFLLPWAAIFESDTFLGPFLGKLLRTLLRSDRSVAFGRAGLILLHLLLAGQHEMHLLYSSGHRFL